jgi:hypothetical protein
MVSCYISWLHTKASRSCKAKWMYCTSKFAICSSSYVYSRRNINESSGNVTVRGENDGKWEGKAPWSTVCLSMYSKAENIYYSQLSSVAILLQPEPNCFTSYNTSEWLCFLSLCAVVFRSYPASHVSSSNGQWSSQLFCVYYTFKINQLHGRLFIQDWQLYGWFRTPYTCETRSFVITDCALPDSDPVSVVSLGGTL